MRKYLLRSINIIVTLKNSEVCYISTIYCDAFYVFYLSPTFTTVCIVLTETSHSCSLNSKPNLTKKKLIHLKLNCSNNAS